jgi:predicted nucleic acid-binding protein
MIIDSCVWVAALDPADRFHLKSRTFLHDVASTDTEVRVPAHALIEVACALTRRLGSPEQGRALALSLFKALRCRQLPLDSVLLSQALELGTTHLLRSGDALFVAAAYRIGETLVSWDAELIKKKLACPPP